MINSIYDLIITPVLTEKAVGLSESQNKYTFVVDKSTTKSSLKKAVESIFSVQVKSVNILNLSGKVKKFKGTTGKRSDRKISIVTLANGSKIDYKIING